MTLEFLWFPTNKCFINGSWASPNSGQTLKLLNPSTGKVLVSVANSNSNDVDDALLAAEMALLGEWGKKTALERGRVLTKMSQLVRNYAPELVKLEAYDVGKPLSQAKNDVTALARYLEFYGACSDKIHGITIPYQNDFMVYALRERLGITAHIIPWNYPMQIIGRSICASLAMGNACILKPSEEACLTALAFGEIAREAGLSNGALNILPGLGSEVGKAIAKHKKGSESPKICFTKCYSNDFRVRWEIPSNCFFRLKLGSSNNISSKCWNTKFRSNLFSIESYFS